MNICRPAGSRFPLAAVRIYFAALRGQADAYSGVCSWRKPLIFSKIEGLPTGLDERKPLIWLGS
jgi:hypothetical protein